MSILSSANKFALAAILLYLVTSPELSVSPSSSSSSTCARFKSCLEACCLCGRRWYGLEFLRSYSTTDHFRVPGISLSCDPLAWVSPHDSVQYARLLGQVVVLSHHDSFWFELVCKLLHSHPSFDQLPNNTKSSPQTSALMSMCWFQNTHGDALPCVRSFFIVFVTFDCLLWAVAVVLYTDCTSFPHRCSPTGSVLSFSHNSTFLSLAVRACMYARLVSLDFSTLGLFPVAVAENSIRTASVGGVAASKTLFFACTYTHLLHAHFLRTSARLHACAHTRVAQVPEQVHCMCVTSLRLAFSLLMSHPSLLFLDGHFETTPDYDLTDDPVHTFLPYIRVLKAKDMRHSAHASRSLATWPSQMQTQVMSPKSSARILPWMMTWRSSTIRTRIPPTSRKPWTRTQANSVFTQCLNPLLCTFLSGDAIGKPLLDREKRMRRFCDQCCRVDVKERLTERYLCESEESQENLFWRVSENSILMNEMSENTLNEELDKLLLVKTLRKLYLNEYKMEIQNLEWRNSEDALIQSQRELESRRQQLLEINGQIKLNEREFFCVADWGWRTILLRSWLAEQLWHTNGPHQALITSSSRKPGREVGMLRDTRENMSIPGNVFDCQHARWDPDELYHYSRDFATPSAIADDVEDSEKRRNWE